MGNTHSENEKYLPQDAINEAVKLITEKISKTNSGDNHDYVCSIQRGRGRFLSERGKPREFKCFVCGGRGHTAQDCPSPRPFVSKPAQQVRCYNCRQPGHIMRNCPEPPVGQNLNFKGPVGRAETRSRF